MLSIHHGIGSYLPGGIVGPAYLPHFDLVIVTAGRVDFTIERRILTIESDDACLIPPLKKFRGIAGVEGATIWVQHFKHRDPKSESDLIDFLQNRPARLSGVARGEWPRALMRRARLLQTDPQTEDRSRTISLLLPLLLQEFLTSANEPLPHPNSVVSKVQQTMAWAKNHRTPLPTIAQMSLQAGWSINHFREKFYEVNGLPVGAFLRELCMNEAEQMLRETNLPIKEITIKVGYSDVISFHHAFKQRFGMTPARYRKSMPPIV